MKSKNKKAKGAPKKALKLGKKPEKTTSEKLKSARKFITKVVAGLE